MPAALATCLCVVMLLLLWVPERTPTAIMNQYGESLTTAIAQSTGGQLLHQERIELAVIATDIAAYPEVSGVVFYDQGHEILAMAGNQVMNDHFTAHAAIDDTITGYVSITLSTDAFTAPTPWLSWLGSLFVLIGVPFLTVGTLQLTMKGNRSLPIVSVPDNPEGAEQDAFCLIINLHNALALGKQGSTNALGDGLTMAQEVCALHPGFSTIANSRGVLVLFDKVTVSASQAICAGSLLLELLEEYETLGEFRGYLDRCQVPRSPAELTSIDLSDLDDDFDLEHLLIMAALARPRALLISDVVQKALQTSQSHWAVPFHHPMLDEGQVVHCVSELPEQQARLVAGQKTVILGFSEKKGTGL
ncbi:MAG: hypothetical protein ACI9UU_003634 [Candidatus Azotimanducaceae bacterium]|jgi:hypothetical protein